MNKFQITKCRDLRYIFITLKVNVLIWIALKKRTCSLLAHYEGNSSFGTFVLIVLNY
jgi:hypothetical protein